MTTKLFSGIARTRFSQVAIAIYATSIFYLIRVGVSIVGNPLVASLPFVSGNVPAYSFIYVGAAKGCH